MVALQSRLLLDLKLTRKLLRYFFEDLHPEFRPDYFPSPEKHNDLGLVAFFDETVYVPYFQTEVMFVYLRPYLDLFNIYSLFLGVLFIKLIFILPEIENFTHRRYSCR